MKCVAVEDAVGMVLAHDLTKIVQGEFKGAAFKKGYIIQKEDIEELKNMGKYNVYVIALDDFKVHENEAAKRLAAAAASERITVTEPLEGKANLKAAVRGLLKINLAALEEVNSIGKMSLTTLHKNTLVDKGQIVAAAKIIPLVIEHEEINKAEEILKHNNPLLDIIPLHNLKIGIVVTGSEVFYGRIKDSFGEVLKQKIILYGGECLDIRYAPDDTDIITSSILQFIEDGAEVVMISGGMAVDADDVTPKAIYTAASKVITYGAPLLPGAMFMLAYHNEIPILGIPACGMFHKATVLDIVFPRILARDKISKEDIVSLAHGGLCLHCESCNYPVCPFGK